MRRRTPQYGKHRTRTTAARDFARQLRKTSTDAEKRLWRLLRDRRFNEFKFRRQYACGIYLLNFYCTAAKLAVELDGGGHGFPDQRARDEKRNLFLAEQGIKVLRFWNHQLRGELKAVRFEIWHTLMERTGRNEEIGGFLPKPAPSPQPSPPMGERESESRPRGESPLPLGGEDQGEGVAQGTFADATLVLLGHGTTQNEDSAAPIYQHAAELRRRKIFADVREAFWKQEPQVKQVLAGISTPHVFIVPLFISEGYFSSEVIPRELGLDAEFSLQTSAFRLVYCRPIGTHDSMTNVLLARAREVVEQFPFPRAPKPKDLTLFIAGHGTERSEQSRKAIERQVELLRTQNLYAGVHSIFMEESPRIAECYQLAKTKHMVLVPFFISDGLHTQEDIPVLLGEPKRVVEQRLQAGQPTWRNPTEKNGKLVWCSAAIGSEPHIADVILERVCESAGEQVRK